MMSLEEDIVDYCDECGRGMSIAQRLCWSCRIGKEDGEE
mgnify:CR=1 FL=1